MELSPPLQLLLLLLVLQLVLVRPLLLRRSLHST